MTVIVIGEHGSGMGEAIGDSSDSKATTSRILAIVLYKDYKILLDELNE
jgi:hypothetical protein